MMEKQIDCMWISERNLLRFHQMLKGYTLEMFSSFSASLYALVLSFCSSVLDLIKRTGDGQLIVEICGTIKLVNVH